MEERLSLARERIEEIRNEREGLKEYQAFFSYVSNFLTECMSVYDRICFGQNCEEEFLRRENRRLYADVLKDNYDKSFANYSYSVSEFGKDMGQLLCAFYAEMRSIIPMVYEKDVARFLVRLELFLEVYQYFTCRIREDNLQPKAEDVKDILYWYISDYSDAETEKRIEAQVCPLKNVAYRIVKEADLSNSAYLYQYGEYVTSNEVETARYINLLPEETICRMAAAFTEGFRRGFEVAGKDLSRKKTVNIRYSLGFERVVRMAVAQFAKMGLEPVLYRAATDVFARRGMRIGYYGAIENPQYDYDHKDDMALFLDGHLVTRRLECLTAAYELYVKEAAEFAGPACMEVFGEDIYQPVSKAENPFYDEAGRELLLEYTAQSGVITNSFIKREERSFTIIAFPTPAIGEQFAEIFDEIIRVNTLDAGLYQQIQQTLIDALDQASYCRISGRGSNRTDLKVMLASLKNPQKETKFENCVADVNIPVGEVFTSPVLEGTNGVLHVTRVFLNNYEYKDLELTLQDGMITDYTCANFATREENRKFIEDNLLFHHKTLPLGEFAIGTNTTAYVAAEKFGIADKLPILIAEKQGPHFAFGDTCYSHEEDVKVYNPDGKEIIAKENSVSALRKEDQKKAYFNCHTDVTIPYEEIAYVTAVKEDGTEIELIKDARFVLKGCEALNKPFEKA